MEPIWDNLVHIWDNFGPSKAPELNTVTTDLVRGIREMGKIDAWSKGGLAASMRCPRAAQERPKGAQGTLESGPRAPKKNPRAPR